MWQWLNGIQEINVHKDLKGLEISCQQVWLAFIVDIEC